MERDLRGSRLMKPLSSSAFKWTWTVEGAKRQQAVLDCIEACIREKGYGPTVREVCQSLGLSSPSTVHVHHHRFISHLLRLERRGRVSRR